MSGSPGLATNFQNRRQPLSNLKIKSLYCTLLLSLSLRAAAQTALTWEQVRERFEHNNPNLLAGALNIDESKAQEITAYLRPNPQFTVSSDGTQTIPSRKNPDGTSNPWQPLYATDVAGNFSYLHERQHKRELRLESARKGTGIAVSSQADLERTLLFSLRGTYVSVLQAKAVLQLAKDNLAYYDHVLDISRIRFKDGDIAKIDLDRLELQRVQYESDWQAAEVGLRTAKIALLTLLNDRTPPDNFELSGNLEFSEQLQPLDEFRKTALENRPDLRAAVQSVDKAKTDHQLAVANGSTDPTFSAWWTYNGSYNFSPGPVTDRHTLGLSVSVPLRIFDRNQGEKLRTQLDITRNEKLRDAAEAQVFSDVDSAYATLNSNIVLLQPYRAKYLQMSVSVRDTVTYAYQKGKASLLDFLNAESDYRAVQLAYINLLGAYMTSAAQLNQAVGKEVMP
jgi:outer membrane protein, heavy metal efflux system